MTAAEHDDVYVAGGELEPPHVLREAVGRPARVEEPAGGSTAGMWPS